MLATTERVRVFWQPGCTSCLRTKEFLTERIAELEVQVKAATPKRLIAMEMPAKEAKAKAVKKIVVKATVKKRK